MRTLYDGGPSVEHARRGGSDSGRVWVFEFSVEQPLEQVLWLLDIVRREKMRLPTAEELARRGHKDFDEAHGVEGWHRLLERRRRRLVKFLQIAVHLEEDLRKGFA